MTAISDLLTNYGTLFVWFMALFLVMALINQVCKFFSMVVKWNRRRSLYNFRTRHKFKPYDDREFN